MSDMDQDDRKVKRSRISLQDPCIKRFNYPNTRIFDEDGILEQLCYPLDVSTFHEEYFRKQAFVVHSTIQRFQNLISRGLDDLNINRLMENTPDDTIQVWVKTSSGKIQSVVVDNPISATALYESGHSLYCRAPTVVSDILIPGLARDLGMGFTTTNVSGDMNGEVELFCARKGHITDWHFDSMENFTIQLKGIKKWKLKKSKVSHALRGCTPHYKTQDVVEQQLKVHRLSDPHFTYGPSNTDEYDEVILKPGSVMYFPAGMWHRVECEEDSVTINLSMFTTSYTEYVLDSLRHILWKDDRWRSGITYKDVDSARKHMSSLLDNLKSQIDKISANDMLPERLLIEGRSNMQLEDQSIESDDDESEPETEDDSLLEEKKTNISSGIIDVNGPATPLGKEIHNCKNTLFHLNPLALLLKQSDIPSIHNLDTENTTDPLESYVLNVQYGHLTLESALRVQFKCSKRQEDIIKWIENSSRPFTADSILDELKDKFDDEVEIILRFLCYNGYISIKCEEKSS